MPFQFVASAQLPTRWGLFDIAGFEEPETGKEHVALTMGDVTTTEPVLVRVHSECLTGDALFSMRCDCGPQLEAALKLIAESGRGMIMYLRQEGRGIGLMNKIKAYQLQDLGADTVEANERLGFHADSRDYEICKLMLDHFHVTHLRLMTNNPRKVAALEGLGYEVVERVPLWTERNQHNEKYLATKQGKLGHIL